MGQCGHKQVQSGWLPVFLKALMSNLLSFQKPMVPTPLAFHMLDNNTYFFISIHG